MNLYGSIQVCHAWDVYKELAKKVDCVKLQRKDAKGEFSGSKGKPKEVEYLLKLYNRTEAEKIVGNLIEWNHIGTMPPADLIKYTVNELQEVGVGLSEDQMCELACLIFEQHNHQHLWCLEGWSPEELRDFMDVTMDYR